MKLLNCFTRFNLIAVGLLINIFVYALPQPVKIGDVCPNVELKKIINFKTSSCYLSDFKGKAVIIDFWQTYCAPCVVAFPKLDSLQREFTGALQFLPVTTDNEDNVNLLFSKLYLVKHVKLFSVVNDTALSLMFPHNIVPHFIWIDKNGIVQKITGEEEITKENIENFLDRKNIAEDIAEKKTDVTEYKLPEFLIANPLIADTSKIEKVNASNVVSQSLLTGHIDGIWGSVNIDTNSVTLANTDIQWLYQVAFIKYGIGASNRIEIDITDSILYKSITPNTPDIILSGDPYDKWALTNTYCYDLHVPLALANKKFDIMLDEINRYFGLLKGIEGRVENRKMKCLVLVRTTRDDKLATKHTIEEVADNHYFLHLQDASFNLLMQKLANYYMQLSPLPILDETGYTGKIDVDINADLADVNAVNAELKKYGLQFQQAEREIKMMVIRKKKAENQN